jgi:polyisoprenoid-binding protein YceI
MDGIDVASHPLDRVESFVRGIGEQPSILPIAQETTMATRTFALVFALLVCFLLDPQPVRAAENYMIDPAHTSIVFSVSHAKLSYTYGFFRKAAGAYILDKTNPANSRFRLTIDADSLDTNHAERDKHLRSADFFDVQRFPSIDFESTSCTAARGQDGSVIYQVTGNMTIHGVTRQITLPLKMLGEGKGPFGDQRSGFLCQVDLKRSDFGMTNLLNMVGDSIGITVSFEGMLQESAAGTTQQR